MARLQVLTLILAVATTACRHGPAEPAGDQEPRRVSSPADAIAAHVRVVFLGDSLAAGLGLAEDQAFPALLERELRRRGWPIEIINAGVSGDTTAGGVTRLGWLLRQDPDVVVVELGANDGLRGLPIESIEDNLRNVVRRSREAGALVLLLGMRIPPNYGDEYADRFEAVYRELAAELDVPLMPFLLEGVGGRSELNQSDGIHPNAEGHRRLAESVLPHLEAVLDALPKGIRESA